MRILLVEDDMILSHALERALAQSGAIIDCVNDGDKANHILTEQSFDIVLLDLGLPKLDGFNILKQLRARDTHTSVLIITARSTLVDRVHGFDLGADDYIIKPFDLPELEARIRALYRRRFKTSDSTITHGTLELNLSSHQVTVNGVPLDLTLREFNALEILIMKKGQVIAKDIFSNRLYTWGDEVSDNAIEVCLHRLRKKLAPHSIEIKTIRGLGYLLDKIN